MVKLLPIDQLRMRSDAKLNELSNKCDVSDGCPLVDGNEVDCTTCPLSKNSDNLFEDVAGMSKEDKYLYLIESIILG